MVPRHLAFWAKSEYFKGTGVKGAISKFVLTGLGAIPVERAGGRAALSAFDAAIPALQGRDLVGGLPGGHPLAGRPALPGADRRGPAGAGGRRADHPGRHDRHGQGAADRRPGAPPGPAKITIRFGKPMDFTGRPDDRTSLRADDRRGDGRDPEAHRPGVRRPATPRRARTRTRPARPDPPPGAEPARLRAGRTPCPDRRRGAGCGSAAASGWTIWARRVPSRAALSATESRVNTAVAMLPWSTEVQTTTSLPSALPDRAPLVPAPYAGVHALGRHRARSCSVSRLISSSASDSGLNRKPVPPKTVTRLPVGRGVDAGEGVLGQPVLLAYLRSPTAWRPPCCVLSSRSLRSATWAAAPPAPGTGPRSGTRSRRGSHSSRPG